MTLSFFILITTLACFFQGITGFGFALIATPLTLIFLDKETVVCSMLVISVVLNGLLIRKIKQAVNWRLISLLFVTSLIGLPFGLWTLQHISLDLLKILVGSLSIIFALCFYLRNIRLPKNNWLTAFVGFTSGFLTTSTTMSGPPVVLLLTGQNLTKDQIRKNLVVFFFLMSVCSVILFLINKIVTVPRISFGLISLPFVMLAGLMGNKIVNRIPQKIFRRLILGFIFFSGVYCIFSGLT